MGLLPIATPTNASWEREFGGPRGRPGVTYASWEFLLRLYLCMTPWNRPRWAEAAGLSGGTVDLEGAGQE